MHHQRGRQTRIERQLIADLPPVIARNPHLTAADRRRRWREMYDEAVACDFAYCIGHRHAGDTFASWETLTPREWARRNGVPSKLVAEWERERTAVPVSSKRRKKSSPCGEDK